MKLVIGMTGSTGVIYGVRIMEVLKEQNVETHLVITEWAKKMPSHGNRLQVRPTKGIGHGIFG